MVRFEEVALITLAIMSAGCDGGVIGPAGGDPGNGGGGGRGGGGGGGRGGADAGAPVDSGPPDAGCFAREEPPAPSAWPFAYDKETYVAEFYGALPNRESTCSLAGCHDVTGVRPPLIPANEALLDDPAFFATAVRELWERAIPTSTGTGVDALPPILRRHRPGMGDVNAPEFQPAQLTFLEGFVARGLKCRWGPVVEREAREGPRCNDAGVCDCPLPPIDLEGCAPIGTSTTSTTSASGSAGLPDAG